MTLDIHVPAGSTGHGPLTVDISADDAGWTYCGLRVAVLGAGESLTLSTGDYELLVLPLAGAATVETGGRTHRLAGRRGVFEEVTDFLDRKSTRLNSSHPVISYAVFCLKKKTK